MCLLSRVESEEFNAELDLGCDQNLVSQTVNRKLSTGGVLFSERREEKWSKLQMWRIDDNLIVRFVYWGDTINIYEF